VRKFQKKYADQDDEERQMILRVIGSKNMKEMGGGFVKDAPAASVEPNPLAPIPSIVREKPAKVIGTNPSKLEQRTAEQLEVDLLLEAEDDAVLLEDMKAKLSQVDELTGKPCEEDTLLYAVPVCAPFGALHGYKYKAKLTPGTQKKKGAICQTCIKGFSKQSTSGVEKELLRAIPLSELTGCLVGNVKLWLPGLQDIRLEEKSVRKKAAKVVQAFEAVLRETAP